MPRIQELITASIKARNTLVAIGVYYISIMNRCSIGKIITRNMNQHHTRIAHATRRQVKTYLYMACVGAFAGAARAARLAPAAPVAAIAAAEYKGGVQTHAENGYESAHVSHTKDW